MAILKQLEGPPQRIRTIGIGHVKVGSWVPGSDVMPGTSQANMEISGHVPLEIDQKHWKVRKRPELHQETLNHLEPVLGKSLWFGKNMSVKLKFKNIQRTSMELFFVSKSITQMTRMPKIWAMFLTSGGNPSLQPAMFFWVEQYEKWHHVVKTMP